MDYERAVAALYQTPLGEFVDTRKRLAAELKAAGDKDGAKRFAKLGRPPISAWAVNQLYWHARDAFDAFMATAARLRDGELAASGAHREALARLRQRAATLISDAGHNANEATLRRTTMTLSAIAATGSFAPDPAGALSEDRDPPGFEAVGGLEGALAASLGKPATDVRKPDEAPPPTDELADLVKTMATAQNAEPPAKRSRHLSSVPMPAEDEDVEARIALARQQAAERAEREERERIAQEKLAKANARERERLEKAIAIARKSLETKQREVEAARHQLALAEGRANDANDELAELESALESL